MGKSFKKLSSLAALGLIAGAMGQVEAATMVAACTPPSADQMQNFMGQLDPMHKAMFKGLDCEGQNLAMKLANQSCAGLNSCKGLNACKSNQNSCKGLGACKGTATKGFSNNNDAVDVAKMNMDKRKKSMY